MVDIAIRSHLALVIALYHVPSKIIIECLRCCCLTTRLYYYLLIQSSLELSSLSNCIVSSRLSSLPIPALAAYRCTRRQKEHFLSATMLGL